MTPGVSGLRFRALGWGVERKSRVLCVFLEGGLSKRTTKLLRVLCQGPLVLILRLLYLLELLHTYVCFASICMNISMYVCMYVCMCVLCVYVCSNAMQCNAMCVCMYIDIYVRMYVCMHACMCACMNLISMGNNRNAISAETPRKRRGFRFRFEGLRVEEFRV